MAGEEQPLSRGSAHHPRNGDRLTLDRRVPGDAHRVEKRWGRVVAGADQFVDKRADRACQKRKEPGSVARF
jgi:hypothetical protein